MKTRRKLIIILQIIGLFLIISGIIFETIHQKKSYSSIGYISVPIDNYLFYTEDYEKPCIYANNILTKNDELIIQYENYTLKNDKEEQKYIRDLKRGIVRYNGDILKSIVEMPNYKNYKIIKSKLITNDEEYDEENDEYEEENIYELSYIVIIKNNGIYTFNYHTNKQIKKEDEKKIDNIIKNIKTEKSFTYPTKYYDDNLTNKKLYNNNNLYLDNLKIKLNDKFKSGPSEDNTEFSLIYNKQSELIINTDNIKNISYYTYEETDEETDEENEEKMEIKFNNLKEYYDYLLEEDYSYSEDIQSNFINEASYDVGIIKEKYTTEDTLKHTTEKRIDYTITIYNKNDKFKNNIYQLYLTIVENKEAEKEIDELIKNIKSNIEVCEDVCK